MALTALGLFAMLMLVIGACRRRIQLARIGDSGNRRGWRPDGTLEWWALALADVGYLLVGVGANNHQYLATKRDRMGHIIGADELEEALAHSTHPEEHA